MNTDVRHPGHARHSPVCWASSIVIHGIIVSAALALASDLTLAPPKEMFTWEVAVVETPAPPEPAAPSPPPVTPTPPEPQPVKTPAPVKPRPMRQEPVVQTTEPVQEKQPMEPTRPVQEVQRVQELQSVQEAQPVKETQPVQEAQLQEALQPVQQTAPEQVTAMTRPVQEESRPSREVTQSVSRSDAPVETAESVEKPLPTVQPLMREPAGAMVQDHAVTSVPAVAERAAVEESLTPVETAQKVEQTVTAHNAPTVQQRTVHHMPLRAKPAARPDYGWLEQRGTSVYLLDLALEESSGHAILDKHTQDMVRKAFPIEVKHALAQPQVQLHLPFSYSME